MRKKYVSDSALLQGCKEPVLSESTISGTVEMPVPMILTLDQMAPNPDNPRKFRNPRYNEIRESIRARGLDTVPKLTKNPQEPDSPYVFSYGGNTRYQVLCELYMETKEERFWRIPVVIIPWPGRLQCLLGHLSENEIRGDLTYLEKAMGVQKARELYQTEKHINITLRELSQLMTHEGFPVDYSTISRMEKALEFLYPVMPVLMESGYISRTKAGHLLDLRKTAEEVWNKYATKKDSQENSFNDVFARVCQEFDNPDIYSLEAFRDELIANLLVALPNPFLTYDRWLLELDPREQNRKKLEGHITEEPDIQYISDTASAEPDNIPVSASKKILSPKQVSDDNLISYEEEVVEKENSGITDADFTFNDPHTSTSFVENSDSNIFSDGSATTLLSALPVSADHDTGSVSPLRCDDHDRKINTDSNDNSNTDDSINIWQISSLQDDIVHLQGMAFKLAFDIFFRFATDNGLPEETEILEDCESESHSCGFKVISALSLPPLFRLLMEISGTKADAVNRDSFSTLFLGTSEQEPLLTDSQIIHLFRLTRIVRRIRELQREQEVTDETERTES